MVAVSSMRKIDLPLAREAGQDQRRGPQRADEQGDPCKTAPGRGRASGRRARLRLDLRLGGHPVERGLVAHVSSTFGSSAARSASIRPVSFSQRCQPPTKAEYETMTATA